MWLRKTTFFLLCAFNLSVFSNAAIALASGIAFALLVAHPYQEACGVWSKKLLQLSVVGLGFGVGLAQVIADGRGAIGYTLLAILLSILAGLCLARLCKVGRRVGYLIAFGTAICGGSAIAALAPTIKAKQEEIAVSLATIFSLNAIALLLFPLVAEFLLLSQKQFAVWAALAIHDTSSVVGAASYYGSEALETAVTVKLTRALWIAPFVLGLGAYWGGERRLRVPLFIIGFIIAAGMRTAFGAFEPYWALLAFGSKQLLLLTLFLIGASVSRAMLAGVGLRPFIFGLTLWVLVSVCTLVVVRLVIVPVM